MRIAVPCTKDGTAVFDPFEHAYFVKIYDVNDGKISACQLVPTKGAVHSLLAAFLAARHVDLILCNVISDGTRRAVQEQEISLVEGMSGDVDTVVERYLS